MGSSAERLGVILPDLLDQHMRQTALPDSYVLRALSGVSREFRRLAQTGWDLRKKGSQRGPGHVGECLTSDAHGETQGALPCDNCGGPNSVAFPFDTRLRSCSSCCLSGPRHLRTLSLTRCKRELLLTHCDLLSCPILHTCHPHFKKPMSVFRWQDALAVALDKHGGPAPLRGALAVKEQRAARRRRAKAGRQCVVESILAALGEGARDQHAEILRRRCSVYVRNGRRGKKELRELLQLRACSPWNVALPTI